MRAFKLFTVSVVVILSLFVFRVSVEAQDAWEDAGFCGAGELKPEEVKNQFVGGNADGRDDLLNLLNDRRVCGTGIAGKDIWGDDKFGGNPVHYCETGEVIPKTIIGRYTQACCPGNKPVFILSTNFALLNKPYCCGAGARDVALINGKEVCWDALLGGNPIPGDNSAVALPANNNIKSVNPPDGVQFTAGRDRISCPQTGCFTDKSDNIFNNNTDSNPIEVGDKAIRSCYARGETSQANPTNFCLAGEWLTEDEFAVANLSNAVSQCASLDEVERERCFECFGRNPAVDTGEPQTFVYSSIGCIDTSRDAFITRLFQLGFGMLSGFAVVRLMWAAVKMQSADPAKIQEGRDMATSAIIAIVTLAAAIPILRYLGINLLSILPFNFLR